MNKKGTGGQVRVTFFTQKRDTALSSFVSPSRSAWHFFLTLLFLITSLTSCAQTDDPTQDPDEVEDSDSYLVQIKNTQLYRGIFKDFSTSQGMDIAQNTIFILEHGGRVHPFDLKTHKAQSIFQLDVPSDFHCNVANFGTDTIPGQLPYLYVTDGSFSDNQMKCLVHQIQKVGESYTTQRVQTITIDTSLFPDFGFLKPFAGPMWLVDKERGFLWAFSAVKRTIPSVTGAFSNNTYHATKFRIPALDEGSEVTLTALDILAQVPFEFDAYSTQGGTMQDGKIYYCYGFGTDESPSRLRVYNTDTGQIEQRYDFDAHFHIELEDIALYGGKIYLNANAPYLYELKP